MKLSYCIIVVALLFSLTLQKTAQTQTQTQSLQQRYASVFVSAETSSASTTTIVHGSCNSMRLAPSPLWDQIINDAKPEIFIWGGDNVYADELHTELLPYPRKYFEAADEKTLEHEYNKLLELDSYKKLQEQAQIVGVFDDHDFGQNDGGKSYPLARESKNILLNKLLKEPPESPRWKHDGIYNAHYFDFGSSSSTSQDKSLGIVLLDGRSFKDDWDKSPSGEMLGEEQWKWLKGVLCGGVGYVQGTTGKELPKGTQPKLTLIVNGLQVLPENRLVGESWSRFPAERQRLFDLIAECKVSSPVLLLAGDVHMAEFNIAKCIALPPRERDDQGNVDSVTTSSQDGKKDQQALDNSWELVEITSSGMTHSWNTRMATWLGEITIVNLSFKWLMNVAQFIMPWTYRSTKGEASPGYFLDLNVAQLDINWDDERLDVQILSTEGTKPLKQSWAFSELSPRRASDKNVSPSSKSSTSQARCTPIHGVPAPARLYLAIVLLVYFFLLPYVVLGGFVVAVLGAVFGRISRAFSFKSLKTE